MLGERVDVRLVAALGERDGVLDLLLHAGVDLLERVREQIKDAVAFAEDSDPPDVDSLAEHVYGDPDYREQFSRMQPGSPFGETTLVFERGLAS